MLVIARRVHPRYPLVLVANRDEVHARPTEPLHAWTTGAEGVAASSRAATSRPAGRGSRWPPGRGWRRSPMFGRAARSSRRPHPGVSCRSTH
ncbi:MAG: NRDE family protein [Dietzia cercidiphylli]